MSSVYSGLGNHIQVLQSEYIIKYCGRTLCALTVYGTRAPGNIRQASLISSVRQVSAGVGLGGLRVGRVGGK